MWINATHLWLYRLVRLRNLVIRLNDVVERSLEAGEESMDTGSITTAAGVRVQFSAFLGLAFSFLPSLDTIHIIIAENNQNIFRRSEQAG